MSATNKKLIQAIIDNDFEKVKENIPQDGNFELVDEVNARQTHQKLIDAVKNGNVAAVKAALESGANTSYDEPKLVTDKDFDYSNVAQDFVINKVLLKDFQGDAIVGDIHGLPPMSKEKMFMLHELAHMEAGNIPRNVTLKEIEEKTCMKFDDFLKGTQGQGNTESFKEAAKEAVENLGLIFVDPATLRDKFNSADKKNKNTPK